MTLRDTEYATELAPVAVGHNRLERLFVKEHQQEEIRSPGGPTAAWLLDRSM